MVLCPYSGLISVSGPSVAEVFRSSWRQLIIGTFVMLATYTMFYIVTTWALSFGTGKRPPEGAGLGFGYVDFLQLQLIAVLFFAGTLPLSGWLADRVGRRRLLLAVTAGIMAYGALFAPLLGSGDTSYGTMLVFLIIGGSRPLGSATGTKTDIVVVTTSRATKAQRHEPYWANRPPAAGPTSVPTPHIADTRADALVHSALGSAVLITAYPNPASNPPAAPWTVLPTSSTSMPGAQAQTRLPAPNTLRLNRYAHRGPNRISTGCTVVAAITEPTRYTVVTQA